MFTGWINVDLCDPNLRAVWQAAKGAFEAQGQKMDSILKFLGFLKQIKDAGKISDDQYSRITGNLDPKNAIHNGVYQANGDHGIYYALGDDGHIVPRFSLKIVRMFFTERYEEWNGAKVCEMQIFPTAAYSGVLLPETHIFSYDNQIRTVVTQTAQAVDIKVGAFEPKDKWIEQSEWGSQYIGPNFYLTHFDQNGQRQFSKAVVNKHLNNKAPITFPQYREILDSDGLNVRGVPTSSGNSPCGEFPIKSIVKIVGQDAKTGWYIVDVQETGPVIVNGGNHSPHKCTKANDKDGDGVFYMASTPKYSKPVSINQTNGTFPQYRVITEETGINVRGVPSSANNEPCGEFPDGYPVRVLSKDPKTGWYEVDMNVSFPKMHKNYKKGHNCWNSNDKDGKFWMSGRDKHSRPL